MSNGMSNGLTTLIAVGSGILSLITTIFWIVVGWRAMRAHEQIADHLRNRQ